MNKLTYFKLELKRNMKLIPYLITAGIALALIIAAVGFCAGKVMNADKIKSKKNLVFSSSDKSNITKIVVDSLSKSESITSLFNVIEADYEDIDDIAAAPDTIVSIVIPADFMHSLMNGSNYPIKLYFSSTTSIYSLIITELSYAAQISLQSAESAIYALYDYYIAHGKSKYAETANDELNILYMKKAFLRGNMFVKKQLSQTDEGGITRFYICTGILTILLLIGCIFILRTKDTNPFISLKLNQRGVGMMTQTITHISCIFITMFTLSLGAAIIFLAYTLIHGDKIKGFIPYMILNLAVTCLCAAAFINMISSLMRSKYSAILLLFITVITMEFISGAFLPSVFLPDILSDIALYLPTTYMFDLIGNMLDGRLSVHLIEYAGAFTLGFIIIAMIAIFISFKRYGMKRRTIR